MKSVMTGILLFSSVVCFAQNITGGRGAVSDIFQFEMQSHVPDLSGDRFTNNINDKKSEINCNLKVASIYFRNNLGYTNIFTFENDDKCFVTLSCLRSKNDNESIKITVDRNSKKIEGIHLPQSCDIDPWVYDDTEHINANYDYSA